MAPRFIGKDPDSPEGGSPSLWDTGDSYIIQGSRVTDPAMVRELLRAAGQTQVPDHETVIMFPKRLMYMFPEAGLGG
jgi:hypothetical protein